MFRVTVLPLLHLIAFTEYKYVCLRADISVMVMGDGSDVIRYDRRSSELYNTPLHMKQDTASVEK